MSCCFASIRFGNGFLADAERLLWEGPVCVTTPPGPGPAAPGPSPRTRLSQSVGFCFTPCHLLQDPCPGP